MEDLGDPLCAVVIRVKEMSIPSRCVFELFHNKQCGHMVRHVLKVHASTRPLLKSKD
jgi:hypothetical protein